MVILFKKNYYTAFNNGKKQYFVKDITVKIYILRNNNKY